MGAEHDTMDPRPPALDGRAAAARALPPLARTAATSRWSTTPTPTSPGSPSSCWRCNSVDPFIAGARRLVASCGSHADLTRARGTARRVLLRISEGSRMSASTLHSATLHVSDLDVWFGTRQVLHGIDLTVQPGRRIGLVGENGSGKSTLLRAIAGTLPARALVTGAIDRPDDLAMLGQEPPFARRPDHRGGARRRARAAAADGRRRRAALARADRRLRRAPHRRRTPRRWTARSPTTPGTPTAGPRRPRSGSGSGPWTRRRRIGTLSGGQRTRLALATLMTTRPACLLLDEPTNHLDDDAIELLSAFLRDLPGVVLLASHDRVLLDDVCTDLFDLDPRRTAARHRRAGRAPLRRRLDGVRGAPRGGAPALGGDVRRAAGGAGPAPGRDPDRHLGDRAQPAAARQRQVHLRLQGRARRPDPGAPQEGRRAAPRGRRARAGAQAAAAAAAAGRR